MAESSAVSFRVTPAEKQLLEMVAEYNNEKPAAFYQRIVLRFAEEFVRAEGGLGVIAGTNEARRRERDEKERASIERLREELSL